MLPVTFLSTHTFAAYQHKSAPAFAHECAHHTAMLTKSLCIQRENQCAPHRLGNLLT